MGALKSHVAASVDLSIKDCAGYMGKKLIRVVLVLISIIWLAGCPPPSGTNTEGYPGGGGYFPDGFTNFIHYECLKDSYGSDTNYIEADEIGEHHNFSGVSCEDWFHYNYDADFTHYRVFKIVDEEISAEEGQVLCYGWEKRNLDHSLVQSEVYADPAVILDYPLSIDKTWTECDFQNISPENFHLNKDVDGDGIDDTINLKIVHNVIGTFDDCFMIEDYYTLHINYSDPGFSYPADYAFTGTSYYRPYIGWVKSELTTNMFSEEKTITREMYDYYVGGPVKQ
jgi:hypothetical protein